MKIFNMWQAMGVFFFGANIFRRCFGFPRVEIHNSVEISQRNSVFVTEN